MNDLLHPALLYNDWHAVSHWSVGRVPLKRKKIHKEMCQYINDLSQAVSRGAVANVVLDVDHLT